MSKVIRLHDFVRPGEKYASLHRTPSKDELYMQLLRAVDHFLEAGRRNRREAEANLLAVADRVRARLGETSDTAELWRQQGRR